MSSALPITLLLVGLVIGLLLGAALGWFVRSSRATTPLAVEQPAATDTAELALSVNQSVNQSVAQTIVPLERAMEKLGAQLQSEEHTSELQSRFDLVCRLLLEK